MVVCVYVYASGVNVEAYRAVKKISNPGVCDPVFPVKETVESPMKMFNNYSVTFTHTHIICQIAPDASPVSQGRV